MVKVARSCGAPKSTREEFPMIGLVLVTHGRLADEFKAALEHVMGPQKQIEAVTIGAEDDSDLCRSDIIRSEEHTSELQSLTNVVCRLLLEKKKSACFYTDR